MLLDSALLGDGGAEVEEEEAGQSQETGRTVSALLSQGLTSPPSKKVLKREQERKTESKRERERERETSKETHFYTWLLRSLIVLRIPRTLWIHEHPHPACLLFVVCGLNPGHSGQVFYHLSTLPSPGQFLFRNS